MTIKLGIRGKLFLISLALIMVAGIISGVYLNSRLKTWLETGLETTLLTHARSAAYTIEIAQSLDGIDESDELADKLGEALSARVTIIDADGRVIGDSEVDPDNIPGLQNHETRPEVIDAQSSGIGVTSRYSSTLGTRMLYAAIPYEREDSTGLVRVAIPMREVESTLGLLHGFIWLAGLFGMIIAVFMSFTASRFMSTRLQKLIDHAHAIADGDKKPMLLDPSHDEISGLAGSINKLAEELERVIEELAYERSQLNAVVEGMEDGVIAVDNGLKITMINSAAVELLGLPQSPMGRSVMEAVRNPALFDLLNEPSLSEPASLEFMLHTPETKIIYVRIAEQRSGEGRIILMRDITGMRKLETTRQDFLANASHELRTPVSVIHANAETLVSVGVDDPEKSRQFLDAIHRNAERLKNLLDDLLQISRIENDKAKLELTATELRPVVERAVDTVSTLAIGKNINLTIQIDNGLKALAEKRALEDVLINILENAVKYTQENGDVTIRVEQEKEVVRIMVEDNGPGITPKHRNRIFERFYRIDPGRSREMGGTGLGLSIVKHIVTVMNGEVSYKPASPHGSIFIITLPSVS